jgi:hypothetical protein
VAIDDDLGRSGVTIEGRLGFQRLVAEVGLGMFARVVGRARMSSSGAVPIGQRCKSVRQSDLCRRLSFTASVQPIGGGRRPGVLALVDARCERRKRKFFLPDRIPAYITWDQYQRNQAQAQASRAARGGAPRFGSALLSGVTTRGRCGMRMTAHYNNSHNARYVCVAMKSNYGEPSCQSLTVAPLDALMTRLVLQALEPAALEASLALATDLEAERAALDLHSSSAWKEQPTRLNGRVGNTMHANLRAGW